MKKNKYIFLFFIFLFTTGYGIKIDRAILSTNGNPLYANFWPLVAKAWKNMGIRPTLALIEDRENIQIDESLGDVIRFKPIEGVSPGWMSMVIRLLLPVYFEDDVCIISDIDMLPLNKKYFMDDVAQYPEDSFVVYRDDVYKGIKRIPMCYNAAKGKIFKEIFKVHSVEDIPVIIKEWADIWNQKISTDEEMLAICLEGWDGYETRCIKLVDKVNAGTRIDRVDWGYEKEILKRGDYYIDSHMLRPYSAYRDEIDELATCIGVYMDKEDISIQNKINFYAMILFLSLFFIFFIFLAFIILKKIINVRRRKISHLDRKK